MQSQFHYQWVGLEQGQVVVFLHGVFGLHRNFRSVARAFSKDYRCLLYDHRGHGKSIKEGPHTVEQLAQDLKFLMDDLNIDKAYIVGHSLGGFVSLIFAQHYPEKIQKLVIIDSSPEPLEWIGLEMINNLKSLPDCFKSTQDAKRHLTHLAEQNVLPKSLAQVLSLQLEQQKEKVVFSLSKKGLMDLILDVRNYSYWTMIEKLIMPTLYIRGEISEHFPKDFFDKIVKSNPVVQGVEIKNAGHTPYFEQPEQFIQALKKFIN